MAPLQVKSVMMKQASFWKYRCASHLAMHLAWVISAMVVYVKEINLVSILYVKEMRSLVVSMVN